MQKLFYYLDLATRYAVKPRMGRNIPAQGEQFLRALGKQDFEHGALNGRDRNFWEETTNRIL